MLPSFPSVTFPNHFTLVTGLYPESHGVVGNTFWDPEMKEDFYYTDPARSLQPKWWNAEPLWVTAEKQGVRTAIHMWPGSEAHIPPIEPTYLDKYNGKEKMSRKVDRLLGLLDLPGDEDDLPAGNGRRPQLLAAYVPNVDTDGHKYGPNSTEIKTTIENVDNMLAALFQGLKDRNLTDIVNVVIVSDHGMATTSTDRLVQLEDLVDLDLIERIDGWPLRGLRPKRVEDLDKIWSQLMNSSRAYQDSVEVYTRETMPERYHFSNNDRIAPIWAIPKTGWAIVERPEWDVKEAKAAGVTYHPRGVHGYDHEHPLMRAIFVARGPKFPHSPNSRVEVFRKCIISPLIFAPSLANLPLKPVGLHSDPDAPPLDTPNDPPLSIGPMTSTSSTPTSGPPTSSPTHNTIPLPSSTAAAASGGNNTSSANEETSSSSSFWDKVLDTLKSLKEWANGLVGATKPEDKNEEH
jgi:predicted AlkP superfamily pyrophosphatase or phosphodiesterase